jgi:hypothetical protein
MLSESVFDQISTSEGLYEMVSSATARFTQTHNIPLDLYGQMYGNGLLVWTPLSAVASRSYRTIFGFVKHAKPSSSDYSVSIAQSVHSYNYASMSAGAL